MRISDWSSDVCSSDLPWEVEQPIASTVHDWGVAVDRLAGLDDAALLATRLRARDDVQQETFGAPGAEHPHTVVLRQQRGLRRARTADTMVSALLGACDGELTMGQRSEENTSELSSKIR